MPDLLEELKALDPVTGPVAVRPESVEELRQGVLASRRSSPVGWIVGVAAAAAMVGVVLVGQHPQAPDGVRAEPAATPSPTALPSNTWRATAASILSPRHSSVTVWADGTFVVIGGANSPVCPIDTPCAAPAYLRDGARYDPTTDRWSRIADAPQDVVDSPLGASQHASVIGRTIYLMGHRSLLAYDLATNQWQELPSPPGDVVHSLGVSGQSLIAVASMDTNPERLTVATLDPDQQGWTQRQVSGRLRGTGSAPRIIAGQVVITSYADPPRDSLWIVDVLDPTTATISHPDPPDMETFTLEPIELTTSHTTYAVWRGREQKTWFLNLATHQWTDVDLPTTDGPLISQIGGNTAYWPLTASDTVAIRGHLYNPDTHLWAAIPPLPTGPDSPLLATSTHLILGCFGYSPTSNDLAKNCYLLQPAAATHTTP